MVSRADPRPAVQGYDVEVRVVASPKLESELGVDKRFLDQFNIDGYGRHVPEGARDAIYDKVPASLDTIHAETTAASSTKGTPMHARSDWH